MPILAQPSFSDECYYDTRPREQELEATGLEEMKQLGEFFRVIGCNLCRLDELDKMSTEEFEQCREYADYDSEEERSFAESYLASFVREQGIQSMPVEEGPPSAPCDKPYVAEECPQSPSPPVGAGEVMNSGAANRNVSASNLNKKSSPKKAKQRARRAQRLMM